LVAPDQLMAVARIILVTVLCMASSVLAGDGRDQGSDPRSSQTRGPLTPDQALASFELEPGYRIEIDGPFSLFESSTRYGLALALALPAIRELDRWSLVADLRWGAARTPLRCRLGGRGEPAPGAAPHLADDVRALLDALRGLDTPWQVTPAVEILDLPGHGVCVPDLTFEHARSGERVHLEVLGYWSRDAVWKRVELVEAGLAHRIVFAVGQHLRVSEAALDVELPAALYVYKRTMSAKAIIERVDALATVRVPRKRGAARP